jgi:FAD/FMN-containing dehydrogenase
MGNRMTFPIEFRGQTWRSHDLGYAGAKQLWNARFSQQSPRLIARCVDVEDVRSVVRYAAENGLPLAVRGGGHGIDGKAMPHDAVVADLSQLKGVYVDGSSCRAKIMPGALLGEMDRELQRHELAVPSGQVSTTGVTGLALGGGIGYLTRRFGLTVDCFHACELITAHGKQVRASAEENPDLFWGLRGAGHNFGVVTSIEFNAHYLATQVVTGFMAFPLRQAESILLEIDAYMRTATRDLCVIPLLLRFPALPGLPESAIGQSGLLFNIVYTGSPSGAEAVFSALAAMGSPILNGFDPCSWVEANSRGDALLPWGNRKFSYAGHLPGLSPRLAADLVEVAQRQPQGSEPGLSGAIALPGMGGAVNDTSAESTAYARTGAMWMWEALAHWSDPARDDQFVSWVTAVRDAMSPHMLQSGYINLSADQGTPWLVNVYGGEARYARLIALKQQWDPDNMFRFNKNIVPQSSLPKEQAESLPASRRSPQ